MPATRRKDNLSTGVSAHGTMSEHITTTGGGIVRDIRSRREPVLREGEIQGPLRRARISVRCCSECSFGRLKTAVINGRQLLPGREPTILMTRDLKRFV